MGVLVVGVKANGSLLFLFNSTLMYGWVMCLCDTATRCVFFFVFLNKYFIFGKAKRYNLDWASDHLDPKLDKTKEIV